MILGSAWDASHLCRVDRGIGHHVARLRAGVGSFFSLLFWALDSNPSTPLFQPGKNSMPVPVPVNVFG